jgi:hypothetical protein
MNEMDKIKLAQRTIALLSSMIDSGECHTARSREMKDNALVGLEQLRLDAVVGRSEQLPPNPITDKEHKDLMKQLYPKDNSKLFRRL